MGSAVLPPLPGGGRLFPLKLLRSERQGGDNTDEHDAQYRAREAARLRYKPDKIEWLLIAEAPPASLDRFFYFENVMEKDYLYIETMKVLTHNKIGEGQLRSMKAEYLQWFKGLGFYLIDAMDTPISGDVRSGERKEAVWGNRGNVLRKLERLKQSITNDTKVILIKASVYGLNEFLRRAGYNVINERMIPFPSTGHQAEYRDEMTRLLFDVHGLGQGSAKAATSDYVCADNETEDDDLPGSELPATLLLDDYCSSFAAHLKECGWDVKTVHDVGMDRKEPSEIVAFAKRNNMVLVVRDERLRLLANDLGARCIPISWALATGIIEYLYDERSQGSGS